MKQKERKSFRTLASNLKARRKRKLTDEQIDKFNKIFDEIEKEQQKDQCDNFWNNFAKPALSKVFLAKPIIASYSSSFGSLISI